MDQSIISTYEDEISVYKTQVEQLRQRNIEAGEKNLALLDKIRQQEDLIGKASTANEDLHKAFEHVREENFRLKLKVNQQDQGASPAPDQNAEALEIVRQKYFDLVKDSVSSISAKDRIKYLERECQRYHRDNTTLGKQVRHLLRTLEEERGMIIKHRDEDVNMTNAADVIDKHLVTFGTIEELQQQNQKILSLLKDMSEREEERENQCDSEEVKKLNQGIQTLREELEEVKNDRERILNAFNTIHKERDLFKILLSKTRQVEHMTPEIFQRMVSVAVSSGPAITAGTAVDESSLEREAHINDLKSIISKLETEIADLRNELAETRSKCDKEVSLRVELLEKAHAKIIEETKRADVLNERNELLEANIKKLTTEHDELRTKCQKMTFEIDQSKQQNEELKTSNDQLERLKLDLTRSLETERQQNQRTACELEQQNQQRQELIALLDQERQARKSELAQLFSELQDKQLRDIEERTAAQVELRVQLSTYERQIQELHNQLFQKDREINSIVETKLNEAQTREAELVKKLFNAEVEVQRFKTQIDESIRSNDQVAANRIKELESLINSEKESAQNKIKELEEILASKEQAAQFEVQDDQLKSNKELQELEKQLERAKKDIEELQRLRNIERENRLELSREVLTKVGGKSRVMMKHRPKKRKSSQLYQSFEIEQQSVLEIPPIPNPPQEIPVATGEILEATGETPEAIEETPMAIEETPMATGETPVAAEEIPEAAEDIPVPAEEIPVAAEEIPEATETPEATEETPVAAEEKAGQLIRLKRRNIT